MGFLFCLAKPLSQACACSLFVSELGFSCFRGSMGLQQDSLSCRKGCKNDAYLCFSHSKKILEKHILSKSTFIRGLQCRKSLFLYKNYIHLRDPLSTEQKALFNRGSNVGLLARDLYPGGTDASPAHPKRFSESVEKTRSLIEAGVEVIYEAAFQYDRVLVALDILVKKQGKWHAYEVKSSSRVSATYILDASLQYYVIKNAGIVLEDFSIVHLNTNYSRQGKLELHKLFSTVSVMKEAEKNMGMVQEKIASEKETLELPQVPDVAIGEHCFSPYHCDFMGQCWTNVPKDSVFNLSGLPKSDLFSMYNSGVKRISEIKSENTLSQDVKRQIEALTKNEAIINRKGIADFLASLQYPLFFLDFETTMPAIPLYENTKPYEHLPFQYSLHYKKAPGAELQHFEFLAETHEDPRKAFLASLLEHTKRPGDILVYYATFERSVFNSLKKEFPEFGKEIDLRLARIRDLIVPFRDKLYYHPAMKGSSSIKNVLPALVPGFSYDSLVIGNGNVAMTVYEQLRTETDIFLQQEKRENLLAYCEMDTLAMVKILEVLEKSAL